MSYFYNLLYFLFNIYIVYSLISRDSNIYSIIIIHKIIEIRNLLKRNCKIVV